MSCTPYIHHHPEPFRHHASYTQLPHPQPQGDSRPPSPLGVPPASKGWPHTLDISTWIDGINDTAIPCPVLEAADSGKTKRMCCKNSPSPSDKENGHKDTSPGDSVSNLHTLHSSHTNEAIMLMRTEQESNDKFCETIIKNTAISLELQLRGIQAAERALQQQQDFQQVLLEVLAHGLGKVN
ncbi:hypothetical protein K439DRAFT_1616017 [Ramaria rubella]|nr:hypothetical protein K439DRAFT_1616017 [Ramaria rubella]